MGSDQVEQPDEVEQGKYDNQDEVEEADNLQHLREARAKGTFKQPWIGYSGGFGYYR